MRGLNILSTAAGALALGDIEFIKPGQTVLISAVDSVATATLSVKFAGVEVFSGPLPIEPGTDRIEWPANIVTCFTAGAGGQLSATLGGTVAGCRTNFLVLNPNEPRPW